MVSDEILLDRIREGEVDAFDLLYARYAARLFSFLARQLGDRAAAEDLLQEVFMTLLNTPSVKAHGGSLKGWLFTVARNRGTSHLRAQGRRAHKEASLEIARAPSRLSPELVVGHRRDIEELQGALTTLPEEQREVVLLKQLGGLTYAEIAVIQGVPEGTVKSRLHLALKSLRTLMDEARESELCAVTPLRAP